MSDEQVKIYGLGRARRRALRRPVTQAWGRLFSTVWLDGDERLVVALDGPGAGKWQVVDAGAAHRLLSQIPGRADRMSDDRTEVAAILLYHTCAAWAGGGPTLSFEELPEEEQEQFRKRAESIANIYGLESRTEAV